MNEVTEKVTIKISDMSFFAEGGQAFVCFPDPDLSGLLRSAFGDTDFFTTIEKDAHDILLSIMGVQDATFCWNGEKIVTYQKMIDYPAIWSKRMNDLVFDKDKLIDIYIHAGCIIGVIESE